MTFFIKEHIFLEIMIHSVSFGHRICSCATLSELLVEQESSKDSIEQF